MIQSVLLLWVVYLAVGTIVYFSSRWLQRPIPAPQAAAFLLLPIAFCLPAFFGGRTIVPVDHVKLFPPWSARTWTPTYNPYLNDVATQLAPWARAVRMAWAEGSLPLRNLWNGCGSSLAANPQSAAFSPFTLAMAALPLAHGFTLMAAVRLLLALTGMWLWLAELEVSATSALVGAIAFAFSMTMMPLLLFPISGVFCLWPWALLAIELIFSAERSRVGLGLLAAVLSAWILTGHPETACLGGVGIGLFLLGRLLLRDATLRVRRLPVALAGAVLAVGLTAFLWLPQLEAVRASSRSVEAARFRDQLRGHGPHFPGWSLAFVTSVLPQALGDNIVSPRSPAAPFNFVDLGMACFGVTGWSLALLILRPGSPRDRREIALLFPLVCGLAIGTGTWPIFEGFLSIPGINLVVPPRFFSWTALFGPALAAFELDRLGRDAKESRRSAILAPLAPVLLGAAIFAVFLWLAPFHRASGGLVFFRAALGVSLAALAAVAALSLWISLRPNWAPAAGVLLAGVALGELVIQGSRLYRWGDPRELFPSRPLVKFLASQKRPFRVVGEASAVFPSTNVFAGVEEIRTHDPMERRDYVDFLNGTCGYDPKPYFKQIRNLEAPVLDFLNVRFLVSGDPARAESVRWRRVYAGADGTVLENTRVLPRVFAPRRIRIIAVPSEPSLNRLRDFGREQSRIVSRTDWSEEASIGASPEPGTPGLREFSNPEVIIDRYRETTNRVTFRARAPGRAIVVASFVNDGGWSARDGKESRITLLAANGPFLGIPLEPGTNAVDLRYAPPGFHAGVTVSALTLLAAVLAASFHRLRSAGRRPSARGAS